MGVVHGLALDEVSTFTHLEFWTISKSVLVMGRSTLRQINRDSFAARGNGGQSGTAPRSGVPRNISAADRRLQHDTRREL